MGDRINQKDIAELRSYFEHVTDVAQSAIQKKTKEIEELKSENDELRGMLQSRESEANRVKKSLSTFQDRFHDQYSALTKPNVKSVNAWSPTRAEAKKKEMSEEQFVAMVELRLEEQQLQLTKKEEELKELKSRQEVLESERNHRNERAMLLTRKLKDILSSVRSKNVNSIPDGSRLFGYLRVGVIEGRGFPKNAYHSLYAGVSVGHQEFKTMAVGDNLVDPYWNCSFTFNVEDIGDIRLQVTDFDSRGDHRDIGHVTIPFGGLLNGRVHEGWYALQQIHESRYISDWRAIVRLSVEYVPSSEEEAMALAKELQRYWEDASMSLRDLDIKLEEVGGLREIREKELAKRDAEMWEIIEVAGQSIAEFDLMKAQYTAGERWDSLSSFLMEVVQVGERVKNAAVKEKMEEILRVREEMIASSEHSQDEFGRLKGRLQDKEEELKDANFQMAQLSALLNDIGSKLRGKEKSGGAEGAISQDLVSLVESLIRDHDIEMRKKGIHNDQLQANLEQAERVNKEMLSVVRDLEVEVLRCHRRAAELLTEPGETMEIMPTPAIRMSTAEPDVPPYPGKLELQIIEARELPKMDKFSGQCDPYCVAHLGSQTFKTKVVKKSRNPGFGATFNIDILNAQQSLNVTVLDWERIGNDSSIGKVVIPVSDIISNRSEDKWCVIEPTRAANAGGELRLKWTYRPLVEKIPARVNQPVPVGDGLKHNVDGIVDATDLVAKMKHIGELIESHASNGGKHSGGPPGEDREQLLNLRHELRVKSQSLEASKERVNVLQMELDKQRHYFIPSGTPHMFYSPGRVAPTLDDDVRNELLRHPAWTPMASVQSERRVPHAFETPDIQVTSPSTARNGIESESSIRRAASTPQMQPTALRESKLSPNKYRPPAGSEDLDELFHDARMKLNVIEQRVAMTDSQMRRKFQDDASKLTDESLAAFRESRAPPFASQVSTPAPQARTLSPNRTRMHFDTPMSSVRGTPQGALRDTPKSAKVGDKEQKAKHKSQGKIDEEVQNERERDIARALDISNHRNETLNSKATPSKSTPATPADRPVSRGQPLGSATADMPSRCEFKVQVVEGKTVMDSKGGVPDAYCILRVGDKTARTATQKKTQNPLWRELFSFPGKTGLQAGKLEITVMDYDRFSKDDLIGTASLDLSAFRKGQRKDLWLTAESGSGSGFVHIEIDVE